MVPAAVSGWRGREHVQAYIIHTYVHAHIMHEHTHMYVRVRVCAAEMSTRIK